MPRSRDVLGGGLWRAAAAALAICAAPCPATAQTTGAPASPAVTAPAGGPAAPPFPGAPAAPEKPPPRRLEPAILPVLGGNTDIGFLFGAYGALARFEPGYYPYRWKAEAIVSMTVKDGPNGVNLPVHSHGVSLDMPGLAGGRLRILSDISFQRDIDARYFGLGNASTSAREPGTARAGTSTCAASRPPASCRASASAAASTSLPA